MSVLVLLAELVQGRNITTACWLSPTNLSRR